MNYVFSVLYNILFCVACELSNLQITACVLRITYYFVFSVVNKQIALMYVKEVEIIVNAVFIWLAEFKLELDSFHCV